MSQAYRSERLDWLAAGGVFIACLALYVTTLAPSVVTLFDDSLEFQLVTYQLGIAHPTGYPLYTLLGKLFTLLPVGNVAYRVNLMSAVFGAATVSLLFLLIRRVSRIQTESKDQSKQPDLPLQANPMGSRLQPERGNSNPGQLRSRLQPAGSVVCVWPAYVGSLVGALLFAVGFVFWQQATIAEVYTLNALFVVSILLIAVSAAGDSPQPVYWLAFLFGLSLTHHRTMLLLLPAVGIYLLMVYGSTLFKPKTVLVSLLLGLLPLLIYLYLPLRGAVGSLDGTYRNSWAGFWQQVTASGYGAFIFSNPLNQTRDVAFYWNLLADQFYTTALGVIGLLYLVQRGPLSILVLTGVALLTYFTFNIFYNVADIEVFFIPVFMVWALWSGLGAGFLLATMARLRHTGWRWGLVGLLLGIFALVIFQLGRTTYPTLKQRYTWAIHDYGLDILRQPLADQPVIVGILGEMTLVRYFQQTENQRPDIETVVADLETDRLAAVERLIAEGKSVYLTRELAGLADRYSLSAVGPLIQVHSQPMITASNQSHQLNQAVTPEITLLSYDVTRTPHTGAGPAPVRLTLTWRVDAPIPAGLKVSARLLDADGQVVAVTDAVPVHFAYPTNHWRSGEIITDVYDLSLAPDAPSGRYRPLIIWYDPAQNAVEVGRIELEEIGVQ
ncbi:MAG: DUF2723 domain-containing protein [Anaerolineaceae bacterium]|nr:DUF2723 domain-containing protein [Anaerolineaceae bacterium]